LDKPDKLQLFDNSEKTRLLIEINKGEIILSSEALPEWITKYLGRLARKEVSREEKIADLKDIDEVRKTYERLRNKR